MAATKTSDTEISRQPQSLPLKALDNKSDQQVSSTSRPSKDGGIETQRDLEGVIIPSGPAILALQRWNEPRGNIGRFVASFYSMFVYGLSDAAPGAALPYVRHILSVDLETFTNGELARAILQRQLHHRVFDLFVSMDWICHRRICKFLVPPQVWAKRYSLRGSSLSVDGIHRLVAPSSMAGRRGFHLSHWFWKRSHRCCVVSMGWPHGSRECP